MSPDPFHTRIQQALQNPTLQAALDKNTETRKNAYERAFATLSHPAENRRQAREVRERVISNLDHYIEEFSRNAKENGFQVHRAADSAEAVRIFLEIARKHNAKLFVKSKTMVSEEIELNRALEAEGLQVYETDLGEFIVQLRGERPAHILTPAVHLRRAEVGQTFQEKLGIPYTDEVETLVRAARKALRKAFFEADIGVSGVNFGVADSGMLCVLTNEGNGRMCTTVPPVHIALMGMERIVPSMADLSTVISVLPRASAGQNITVYTNLIKGPAQPGDPDGPNERHIILIDNGRLGLQGGPLMEALNCIRCGACLNACPVFREIGGHAYVGAEGQAAVYSGPIGSVISPGLFGSEAFANLAHASSLCGACRDACPVGIDLPRMLLDIRAGGAHQPPRLEPAAVTPGLSLGLKIYSWFAASPFRFRFAQRMAGFFGRFFSGGSGWMRLPAFTGWGVSRDFPQPVQKTFRARFQERDGQIANGSRKPVLDMRKNEAIESSAPPEISTQEQGSLLDQFTAELTRLEGTVIHCRAEELAEKITVFTREDGMETLSAWGEKHFPPGLFNQLQESGIEVRSDVPPAHKVGLTGCVAAVAETGSVVLVSGPSRPLLASLLPETHLVVVKPDQFVPTLTDALQLDVLQEAANSILISGPSRTGDIELTLTVGVHGPKRLIVFCLRDEGG